MKLILLGCVLLTLGISGCMDAEQPVVEEDPSPSSTLQEAHSDDGRNNRPNILLIVADDLGYSDLGSYGSQINTPNLDALADAGIKFSQFYAGPTCSVTRSMLMSGVDSHKAGLGTMRELMLPAFEGKPGYEGYLNHRVVTFVRLLRDSGYHTYMAGKWHLGLTDDTSPTARGFEKSFALLHGGANHFDERGVESHDPVAFFRENGEMLDGLPEDFDYSTNFYTRKIIEQIDSAKGDGKPFFAYMAYTSPHWPLQVPEEDRNKYLGKFDAGYEALREARLAGLKEKGLMKANVSLPELPNGVRPWNELSADEKKLESRKMELYAAMLDNMDVNVGKIIQYLKDIGEYENTFVFFMSDNGADAADVLKQQKFVEWIADYDNSYESMGSADSFVALGRPWAHSATVPLSLWKTFSTEGGIRVPAIMSFPNRVRPGLSHSAANVLDILPTFLELAGVEHPGEMYKGRKVEPVSGKSLLPLLEAPNTEVHGATDVIGFEILRRSMIRKGDWKLLLTPKPHGSGEWELFNIAEDPLESNDLADQLPDVFNDMMSEWQRYEKENRLIYAETSPI